MNRQIFTAIFLLSTHFLLFSGLDNRAEAQDAVRIGAIFPLTGDGAFWGENPKKAIELALEDLKGREGISALQVKFEDDRCSAKDAVSAFHKLVDVDKVNIILGPSCSSAAAALVPLAQKSHVLLITFVESDEVQTGEYVLRLWVPNSLQGRKLAEYAFFKKALRSLAILSTQNAFGASLTKAFKEKFVALGGRIVGQDEYLPTATSFRPELTRLKASHPDGLLFASYIKDGAVIVREAKQLGITIPLFGPSTVNSPDFFKSTKELAEGLVLADLPDSSSEPFKNRWQAKFGTQFPGIQSGAPLFYDVVMVLGTWLRSNHSSSAGNYLRSIDYPGVSGRLKFTREGNLDRRHSLFIVKDGKVELVEN